MLSVDTNIREAYARGSDDEQNFIQNLSLFLCTYLKEHAQLVEKKLDLHPLLMTVSCTSFLSSVLAISYTSILSWA